MSIQGIHTIQSIPNPSDPNSLTNHELLLAQVRQTFHNGSIEDDGPENSFGEILNQITDQKKEHQIHKEKLRHEKQQKRKNRLKQARLSYFPIVQHANQWQYSNNLGSKCFSAFPPMSYDDDNEHEKPKEDISKMPWLPTCLHGHHFGIPSVDSIPEHQQISLRKSLEENIQKCQKELSQLHGSTEEILNHRFKCTQALREFNELLQELNQN